MNRYSIIINNNNNNVFKSRKCVDSVLQQTYNNYEIIMINHNKEMENDIKKIYKNKVKIINLIKDDNFISDIKTNISGDYILIINDTNIFSCDALRIINQNIENSKCDILIANFSFKEKNKYYYYNYSWLTKNNIYTSKECTEQYIKSNGFFYDLSSMVFSKKLLENINFMEFDDKDNNLSIFLTLKLLDNSKKIKILNDVLLFKNKYVISLKNNSQAIKKIVLKDKKFKQYHNVEYNKSNENFLHLKTDYDNTIEDIKNKIIDNNYEIVSFDLFDTLVYRPFYKPSDLFELMNDFFINIVKCDKTVKFSKIRIEAESFKRLENDKLGIKEVTLYEIYDYIKNNYCIKESIINELMKKEIELEERYCIKRNNTYDIYSFVKAINKRVIVITDIYHSRETIEKILKNNDYHFDSIYISSEIKKTKEDGEIYEFVKRNERQRIIHIGDNYKTDILNAGTYGYDTVYLPKAIDSFMGKYNESIQTGAIYQDFDMYNINMKTYLKISGVRTSLSLIANKYFDNPYRGFNIKSSFNRDPYYIGYYSLGMQLISLINWLLLDCCKNGINNLVFMSRDGYLPLKGCKILKEKTSYFEDIDLNYVNISRKATIPLLISEKVSLSSFDSYIDYIRMNPKSIIDLLNPILKNDDKSIKKFLNNNNINLNKRFQTKQEFYQFLNILYDELYDEKLYKRYKKICKEYYKTKYYNNCATFDIGYSVKPEVILKKILNKNIHTYFYHTTSSEGFNNALISNIDLKTFCEFTPTLTGTIRELFYSDTNPTCTGYVNKNNDVIPLFDDKEDYQYYNRFVIHKVQEGALDFIDNYVSIFKNDIKYIDFNKFYMSIPYEYYCHYTTDIDKYIFNDLMFESNENDIEEMNYYIRELLDDYNYHNKKREEEIRLETIRQIPTKEQCRNELINEGYHMLPNNRLSRILFYILFSPKTLIRKIKKQ